MNTYECVICREINTANRLHCKSCGTTPAMYSALRMPSRFIEHNESFCAIIPVIVALGADRTERHRTCKRELKTVAADYYADSD